jgi:hypothetical protein
MKCSTWAVLGTAAFLVLAVAVFAGQDDIRRFRRMRCM